MNPIQLMEDKMDEKNFLTVLEAANIPGLKPSRIRTALARGELAYLKIGNLIRIPKQELIKWLEACRVSSRGSK